MSVLDKAGEALQDKLNELSLIRQNTQEYGISTPVVSLEIVALSIVASGINLLRTKTNNDGIEL